MTTKRYVSTVALFGLLLALAPVLFFVGLFCRDAAPVIFYLLAVAAGFCLASAILLLVWNYKRLAAYDAARVRSMVEALDFSVVDMPIDEKALGERLCACGYAKAAEGRFHKKVKDDVGDGVVVSDYYAAIFRTDTIVDSTQLAGCFDKSMIVYNVGYIFVDEQLESNLDILKKYIIDTIVDTETRRYKCQKFFVPLVIAAGKLHYVKSGFAFGIYERGVMEGLCVLGCSE